MECGRCAAANPDGNRFCEACGSPLDAACPACGAPVPPGARFCGQCGASLGAASLGGASLGGGAPSPLPAPPAPRVGERKHVTILFADIRGSTELIRALDPEQAMEHLDPALTVMADSVRRYGGTVNRVQGDGIMALFGAPRAQEDHAASACLAAQAMIRAAAALGDDPGRRPQIRVGLHSGTVVIRPTGHDPNDWDAAGIAAHLANRMEQLARPGTACLSAETARLARGFVDVRSLGPVAVRGLDAPVEAFELLSATDRSSWDVRSAAHPLTRFVGRRAELELLAEARRRAELGHGQAVTLRAEAGTGKSRLAREFVRAAPPGWKVLRASALPHDTGIAHRVSAELARAWLGAPPDLPAEEVGRRLQQTLALSDPRLAAELPAFQALLDLKVEDPDWAHLSPAARQRRTTAALRLLLLAEAREHPLLVLVEDLHWIDDASDAALAALVEAAPAARLLVLATTRPEHRVGWAGHGWASEIRLAPLDEGGADAILRQLLGDGPELAALRRQVIAQTDGTPLFLEEVARSLREAGLVVTDAPRVRLTRQVSEIEIPSTVQAVLASRIDRLPPARRALLQTAAVIGRDVPLSLLAAVTEAPETALRAEMAALQAAEFLFAADLPSGLEYSFKHALTHAVAYDATLRRRRRELHARVLAALEAGPVDPASIPERLAHHAVRGEVWDKAAGHAQRAGLRANARSAWREAVGFFDMALEALGHCPDAPDADARGAVERGVLVRLGLRVPLLALGEYTRAVALLEEARDVAGRLGDPARMRAIDVSRCTLLANLGRLDEAARAGARGRDSAHAAGDGAGFLDASFGLGQTHWFHGDFAAAEAVLSACLPVLRGEMRTARTGTTGTASVLALVCLSKTHAITGDFPAALDLAREAEAVAAETRRPYDLSYAALGEGFARLLQGETEPAILALEQALEHARNGEIALLVPSIARYLGRAYAVAARHEESHALLREALGYCASQSLVGLHAWCNVALAHTHLGRPHPTHGHAAAGEALTSAIELAARHGYRPVEAQAHRLLAQAQAEGLRADLARAEASCRKAVALATALGMRPEAAAARRALAGLLDAQGRGTEARTERAASAALCRGMGMRHDPAPLDQDLLATS